MSSWGWTGELEAELEAGVPEGLDPDQIEAHMVLRMDLRGAYGETHLVVAAGALWVWTRSSMLTPLLRCPLTALPRLEGEGFDWELVLTPVGAEPARLLLMVADHDAARSLLASALRLGLPQAPRAALEVASAHPEVLEAQRPAAVKPHDARLTPALTLRWGGASWDELESHERPVSFVVFGGEGGLVSASEDGAVVSWRLDDVSALWSAKQGLYPTLSPDGHHLAQLNEGGEVEVWDLEHEQLRGRFKPSSQVRRLCYLPDGSGVGVEVNDGIELWVLEPVKRTGRTRRQGARHQGLCFAPDAIRAACIIDATAVIIHPKTSRREHTLEGDGVLAIAFIDADRVVCVYEGGALKVWSLHGSQPQVIAELELGDVGECVVLATSPGAHQGQIACGSARGEVFFCDEKGTLLRTLSVGAQRVSALAWDAASNRIAVGLEDRVEIYERRDLEA